jgi:hypothetical protein
MTLDDRAAPESAAQRLRQRIFHPWTRTGNTPRTDLPAPQPEPKARTALNFQARIAEFLLIHRLRARHKSAPSVDVLQRAERIVFITCQNWFAVPEPHALRRHTHTQL